MTLAELIQGFQKFSQFAGDLPVVIRDVETEAETILHSIGIQVDPSGNATGKVTINHAATPPAPAVDTNTTAPVDPAPADPATVA